MKGEPPSLHPRLDAWLEVATRGLCDDAGRRIRSEISDHYESALEAARANGAPTRAAEDTALSTLGDPALAARSFRRTNLTRFQAALVRDHREQPPRGVLILHFAILAAGIAVVSAFPESPAHRRIGLGALALMTVSILLFHHLAPRSYERGSVKGAVMASALAHWLFYAATCVGLPLCTGAETAPYAAAFFGAVLVLLLVLYVPLLAKVRRCDSPQGAQPE